MIFTQDEFQQKLLAFELALLLLLMWKWLCDMIPDDESDGMDFDDFAF